MANIFKPVTKLLDSCVNNYIKQLHLKWAPPSWKRKALTESSFASHQASV